MRIKLLTPQPEYQEPAQSFVWPPRNREPNWDFGVEQDWSRWLHSHPDLLAERDADWACLDLWWNRWFLGKNDEDGHWGGSQAHRAALQDEIDRLWNLWRGPWFTVAEADIRVLQPYLDLHGLVVFTASRRAASDDIDIPLLSAPHPQSRVTKKWLACFLGHMQTDGIRTRMGEALAGRADCRIEHANHGPDEFARAIQESYIALAPRGQGAQSFRFYEAMQLGVVPLYLSDLDARPFKRWIDWERCSLHRTGTDGLGDYLDRLDRPELLEMGQRAGQVYHEHLGYGRWCQYVIKELL
jgi:hypothetical protein